MTIITYKNLQTIRKRYENAKIVFCTGTFDLTHAGHILFFEVCKQFGDILVVGVGSDLTIKRYKGKNRPILNEYIRIKTIDSLKPVNYCFIDTPDEKNCENGLYSPLEFIFEKLRPDNYIVNDDVSNLSLIKKITERKKIKLIVLKRSCSKKFDEISTSKIIEKIKKL